MTKTIYADRIQPNVDTPLKTTSDILWSIHHNDYCVVKPTECKVLKISHNMSLTSFGYCLCRGIVLKNDAYIGLAHLLPIESKRADELDDMITIMQSDSKNMNAILVAGQYPELLEEMVQRKNIPIKDHYYDDVNNQDDNFWRYQKDIIVMPTGEVQIHTRKKIITKQF